MGAKIQNEIDVLASSISSTSSEPRSSTKIDRIDAMAASDDEDGDERRDGPATPDLIDEPAPMEYLSMRNLVYQDDALETGPQLLGCPRQKEDPRGRNWVATTATAADWLISFPLSDGSDGGAEDKPPLLHDDQDPAEADLTDTDFEDE
jgi:hypothetical protein